MRFYVYALIDPTNGNRPFYIGKGLAGRLQAHFKSRGVADQFDQEVIGCDPASLVADAREHFPRGKAEHIDHLLSRDYTERDIARVIARSLDETTAFALEAFLIRSVYGLETLHNKAEGAHPERFRPRGQWAVIPDFDLISERSPALAAHYVYALLSPVDGRVFYVGKGAGSRVWQHFSEATSAKVSGKLDEIRRLILAGYRPSDLTRILAWVDNETSAFALEALAVKFVFGLFELENIQRGHHHRLFRAKDDWALRIGFDLPFVTYPGQRQDRTEMLDGMIGEGIDRPLSEIRSHFPELIFDAPKVLDSADLGIEADVTPPDGSAGARLKIFIRRERIHIELRHRRKAQREWIKTHFSRLGAYPLRRGDDVFYPTIWRGPGMTKDIKEAIHRVRLMLQIVNARGREDLSEEACLVLAVRNY